MAELRAIAVVATGLIGLVLVWRGLPWFRRTTLTERLAPYLGALGPQRSRLLAHDDGLAGPWARLFGPGLAGLGARAARLVGDDGRELSERLEAADARTSPSAFRAEQAAWGIGGLALGLSSALLAVGTGRAVSPITVLAAAVAFALVGVVARDRVLTRAVRRRRAQCEAEFPTFVDMVCVAVTAGESLRGALDLVASLGPGPLAGEVRIALQASRAGRPLRDALESRAAVIGVPAFDRFVRAATTADERGIALADGLRAMAFDVREEAKRAVVETAGTKQVSMLVPVIGLILPVAVVFAFFPGVVAIKTLSG